VPPNIRPPTAGRPARTAPSRPQPKLSGRGDRGSVTIEQLMWGLFWLGVIAGAVFVIGPWLAAKVSAIIGY